MNTNAISSAVGGAASRFFRKNGGTILTCLSALGVAGTAYLSGRAAVKANEELKTIQDAPILEKIKILTPVYILPTAVGIATVACMFGANSLNRKQQASMLAAGAILEQTYKKYRDKAEELLGDNVVDTHIAEDEAKDLDVETSEKLFYYNYYEDGDHPEYGSYFQCTDEKVWKAKYELNRLFRLRSYATLNDFFRLLGVKEVEGGDELGWSEELGVEYYGYSWIDIDLVDSKLDDGADSLDCTIITTPFPPTFLA